MRNIFIDVLPPWVETGLQPAFYDLESGTVLQQTARMYAKVRELNEAFNQFSEDVSTEINNFEHKTNTEIERFEHETNTEIERFEGVINDTVEEYIKKFNDLHDYVEDYFDNLDVQEEINNKLDAMVEDGTLGEIANKYFRHIVITPIQFGATGDGVTNDTQALQDAIDYAIAHGVKLFIPSGNYLVSKLTINGCINMEGNGFDSVFTSIDNNSENAIIYIENDGIFKSDISKFRIQGNKSNNAGTIHGMLLNLTSDGTQGDKYAKIHDISIYDCTGNGFATSSYYGSGIREIRVSNLDVAGCNLNGVNIRNTTDSFFDNITSHSNIQHGFFLSGGNHKISNCKAFYNGKGDETTIEEGYRIPANAFRVTDDASPVAGKQYYTRSGSDVANDWYEFTEFNDNVFEPDTTYYELETIYYKRYSGFNCSTSRSLYTNCEAQENYGDGFTVWSSDNSFTSIMGDANGLLTVSGTSTPQSYADAGLTQLYYGVFSRCYRTTIYGQFLSYSYNTYGATQKAPVMFYRAGQLKGSIFSDHCVYNALYTQGINQNQIDFTVNNIDFRYTFTGTITPSDGYEIFDMRLNKIDNVVYLRLVVAASNGQILPDTAEHILLNLPEGFRPLTGYGEQMGTAPVSNNYGYNCNKYCSYRLTAGGQLSIRSSSAITDNKYVLFDLTFPTDY